MLGLALLPAHRAAADATSKGARGAAKSSERFDTLQRTRAPIARIAAGTFVMGSDDADIAFALELCRRYPQPDVLCDAASFSDEQPIRRVQLPAFAIDRTEVSNAAYRRCARSGVCVPGRVPENDTRLGLDAQPVVQVTAAEAEAYCAFVGGRLPTEAEWERAARAGSRRRFPWGNAWNARLASFGPTPAEGDKPLDGYAYAAPVGAFADGANPHGMLDMAGNVWELTADDYDRDAYQHGYAAGAELALAINPTSASRSGQRVIRGGSFASPPQRLRTTQRAMLPATETRADVGFRCAYAIAAD